MEVAMRSYPNGQATRSFMYDRGVGGGSSGGTHGLIEEAQVTFRYTIGPHSEPVTLGTHMRE